MPSSLNLDNLEAIARAATDGPWEWRVDRGSFEELRTVRNENILFAEPCGYQNSSVVIIDDDAAHIAAFNPAAALELIQWLRNMIGADDDQDRARIEMGIEMGARIRQLEAALAEACDLAEYRPRMNGERLVARIDRIAELRKLVTP